MGISYVDPVPGTVTVTPNGSGINYSSNFFYCIRAIYADGSKITSPATFRTACATTPSVTHFNTLVWTSTGASSYEVYRMFSNGTLNGPGDAGKIGSTAGNNFQDTGQSADGSLAPNNGIPLTISSITNSTDLVVSSTAYSSTYLDGCFIANNGQSEPFPTITAVANATHISVTNTSSLTTGSSVIGANSLIYPPTAALATGIFSDSTTTADNLINKALTDTRADIQASTDAIFKALSHGLSDTESITDNTITKAVSSHLADFIIETDTLKFLNVIHISDTEALVEGFRTAAHFNRSFPENILLSDALAPFKIGKGFLETIRLNDWISIQFNPQNAWGQ